MTKTASQFLVHIKKIWHPKPVTPASHIVLYWSQWLWTAWPNN